MLFVSSIVSINAQTPNEMHEYFTQDQKAGSLEEMMLQMHGSFEDWISTLSITFVNETYDFKDASIIGNDGFSSASIYKYKISLKPFNSMGYANFIMLKGDNRILYDGKDIITIGLEKNNGYLDKSPALLLFYEYALLDLPWLTQVDGVKLTYAGTGKLPLEADEYEILKMTFEDEGSGYKHEGYYELYINPESGLLKGVRHTAIFPKLPGTHFDLGVPSLPEPLTHIFKGYTRIGKLLIPNSFVTFKNEKLMGISFIEHSSINKQLTSKQAYNASKGN